MSLLEHIFGGAKPPFGAPPFAPPHPQTGGAQPPADQPHGLAGYIDRFFNPANPLGQFGQALMAAGGGPVGNAMALMLQQRALSGKDEHDFSNWKQQYDYEVAHPKPSTAGPHYWESNDGSLHAIGDDGKPVEVYHDPSPRMQLYTNPTTGAVSWVPVPGTGASGGSATPMAPVGDLTPLDDTSSSALPEGGYYPAADKPAGYDTFKKAIIGQESGGRYGVANTEGSGAMGVGQVMPGTARVLAGRLGLPYQPNLLSGTDPASQDYQNRITDAAALEAWKFGGGDPAKAAMYYFGGSDQSKWGPKTHRYASDILSRIGG